MTSSTRFANVGVHTATAYITVQTSRAEFAIGLSFFIFVLTCRERERERVKVHPRTNVRKNNSRNNECSSKTSTAKMKPRGWQSQFRNMYLLHIRDIPLSGDYYMHYNAPHRILNKGRCSLLLLNNIVPDRKKCVRVQNVCE